MKRAIVALSALLAVFDAQAQIVVGHDISWGAHGVPLSPALSAAIAVVLGLAAYAVLRKRSGAAAMALLLATGVGLAGYQLDSLAISGYLIETPSGSDYVPCGSYDSNVLTTSVTGGVVLSAVTPDYQNAIRESRPGAGTLKGVAGKTNPVQVNNGYPACVSGMRITPSSPCRLTLCTVPG